MKGYFAQCLSYSERFAFKLITVTMPGKIACAFVDFLYNTYMNAPESKHSQASCTTLSLKKCIVKQSAESHFDQFLKSLHIRFFLFIVKNNVVSL